MERRNLDVDKDNTSKLFVTWSKDGTKADRKSSLNGDETKVNCNLGLSEVKKLDQKLEILVVNFKAGPSEVSFENISAPSVNSTVETRAQCSSAPSGILLNSQHTTSCCNFSPSACACGWCRNKYEEFNGTRQFNEAINREENLDWYVSRESWEASEPNNNLEMSSHERAYVVVGHTVTAYCTDLKRCSQLMRALQRNAMNAGYKDIPYHFVIAGDGRAYEGRTWQAAPESAYSCDNNCLFVSFTGDYRNCCSAPNHIPSEEQIQAFDYILDTSRRLNRLKEDFAIVPQCKVASSQSPGLNLYNAIKKCNQFDSTAGNFNGFCNLNCAGEC
ncbi:N-acetylmuramoyl-L-alanine amidase isoform X2 [Cephus cinctus]|uniref:N-acetylmuramoyl-L-alanine amidase isoform X2 n=1 Tax=Cephus cinctus TaxID=211228 RepID=A0AAJ7RRL9_CEPCN|nr:N-acetylmuramoyl-L-alanine amidase isoform X2 [Cephus cinctus]